MERDFYEVLGVEKNADPDTIKKAYRKLAMQFHPDKNPGDKSAEDKFKEAARAYEILSNSEKRARYDRFGMAGINGHAGMGGPQGFHDVSDVFEAFGDIFGDFFGGMGRSQSRQRNRPRRGSDLRYGLEVALEDVLTAQEEVIEFDVTENCKPCGGSGAAPGSHPESCAQCGGRGQVFRQQGFFSVGSTCPVCRGTGQMVKDPCKECKGQGKAKIHRKISVHIPAGVGHGTQLRLSGEGEGGYLGGPAGDLYVEIHVKPNARFEREDEHLIAKLEISYLQALLGGEVDFKTLSGELEKVEIPKGTADGEVIRIKGLGLPSLRGARTGDLHLQVRVNFPKKLDKKEEQLLRQIAEEKGEKVSTPKKGLFS